MTTTSTDSSVAAGTLAQILSTVNAIYDILKRGPVGQGGASAPQTRNTSNRTGSGGGGAGGGGSGGGSEPKNQWTDAELNDVMAELRDGESYAEVGKRHNRSEINVRRRIGQYLGYRRRAGDSVDAVSALIGRTNADVNELIDFVDRRRARVRDERPALTSSERVETGKVNWPTLNVSAATA